MVYYNWHWFWPLPIKEKSILEGCAIYVLASDFLISKLKKMKKIFLLLFLMLGNNWSFGQALIGNVTSSKDKTPIDYVSIGVVGMDVGTVSEIDGRYQLAIGKEYDEETLRFSCIGFKDFEITVKDFRKRSDYNVQLSPMLYELAEVIVTPNIFGRKTVGHTGNSKMTTAGFGEYKLGFEHAVRMKLSKNEKAIIQKVNINIARCTFDSLLYRVNVYSIKGKKQITSILKKAIYVNFDKSEITDQISFNLEEENIIVSGDFLVSLEHIKDLGEGEIAFSTDKKKKTYVRKTSQGKWKIVDTGISISADLLIIK